MTYVVCGQEVVQHQELVCISFLINEALWYVMHYTCVNAISDHLLFRLLQWFQLIVENRPKYSENVTQLSDINDIRNGVFANNLIHGAFDLRDVVLLKVRHLCPPILSLSH